MTLFGGRKKKLDAVHLGILNQWKISIDLEHEERRAKTENTNFASPARRTL